MKKDELQKQMDIEKWYDSQKAKFDTCGTYSYCKYCIMDEATPCANAFMKMGKEEKPKTEVGENGYPINIVVRSFEEKLDNASEELQSYYHEIRNQIFSYKDVHSRISKKCENFRAGRGNLIAKLTIVGKSLRVNLPIDINDEKYAGRKLPHKDLSDKKTYEECPFQIKITSGLALRRCLELICDVANEKELQKKKIKSCKI